MAAAFGLFSNIARKASSALRFPASTTRRPVRLPSTNAARLWAVTRRLDEVRTIFGPAEHLHRPQLDGHPVRIGFEVGILDAQYFSRRIGLGGQRVGDDSGGIGNLAGIGPEHENTLDARVDRLQESGRVVGLKRDHGAFQA